MADQLFDRLHGKAVFRDGEGEGVPLQARAASAADPVHVILGVVRTSKLNTCERPPMSRPRAATSLHTSNCNSPALNFSSVAKRTV